MSSKTAKPPVLQAEIFVHFTTDYANEFDSYRTTYEAEARLRSLWEERQEDHKYCVDFSLDGVDITGGYKRFRDDAPPCVIDELDMYLETLNHAAKLLRKTN